nr:glycosyltransferase [uncultured Butyrivibrio sp.]
MLCWEKRADTDIELTVIIPTHNVTKYLNQCIESITKWKSRYVEFLFVDDGSRDETRDIILEWAGKDARIRLVDNENGGTSSAKQLGIEMAKGRYVGFINPKDFIDDRMFFKLMQAAMTGSYEIAYCGYKESYEGEGGYKIVPDELGMPYNIGTVDYSAIKRLVAHCNSCIYRGIYKKTLLDRAGIHFYTDLRLFEDLSFEVETFAFANSGYGNTMNIGFKAAKGDYIGIVESDDFIDRNMFETLYERARTNELDVVKSGFFLYYSDSETNVPIEIATDKIDGVTVCPSRDFADDEDMVDFYNQRPAIWSAIYRRKFINENKITFLESPGASYQDTGFNLKVLATAKRVQYINGGFLHYRQDNIESSVNSKGKAFCVYDEYNEFEKFIKSRGDIPARVINIMWRQKYETYTWNYMRLSGKYKFLFLQKYAEEFKEGIEKGTVKSAFFTEKAWNDIDKIVTDFVDYYFTDNDSEMNGYKCEVLRWKDDYFRIKNSLTYKIGFCITFLPRTVKHFFVYTKKQRNS